MFHKINHLILKQSYAPVVTSDEVAQKIIMEQYAYVIYADYDVIVEMDGGSGEIDIPLDYNGKKVLMFIRKCNKETFAYCRKLLDGYIDINFIMFIERENIDQISVAFSVSEDFAYRYIEYLVDDFPQIISDKSDKDILIELCGYNLYNLYHMMQECYYKQVTVKQIDKYNFIDDKPYININNNEMLVCTLGISAVGIHEKLAEQILGADNLIFWLRQQYFFYNMGYIIPNIYLYLQYKNIFVSSFLKLWNEFDDYIKTLVSSDDDRTIVAQTVCILQKTITHRDNSNKSLDDIIFRIVGRLHKLFRFIHNVELLELYRLCMQYFESDKLKIAYLLVDEAILYEDIEKFDVAKQKFELSLEICDELKSTEVYIYVTDEFSRLLEKTSQHKEALKKLYYVEKYYQSKGDSAKLRNVRNRIGINLSFVGNIRAAINYLEKIYFGDFNGKINAENVLSCEVANNLSICYMEFGNYGDALKLQDNLYKIYKIIEDAPINYATDILQNKGNVYLFQHNYKAATECFEIALNDEKNPVSKELILENYLYAKALRDEDFSETISFFESQIKSKEDNETQKMLAELYYAGGLFENCFLLCKDILNNIRYETNEILYILVDILFIKSMFKIERLSLIERVKAMMRLNKYQKFIIENIGKESPYFEEYLNGKRILGKK